MPCWNLEEASSSSPGAIIDGIQRGIGLNVVPPYRCGCQLRDVICCMRHAKGQYSTSGHSGVKDQPTLCMHVIVLHNEKSIAGMLVRTMLTAFLTISEAFSPSFHTTHTANFPPVLRPSSTQPGQAKEEAVMITGALRFGSRTYQAKSEPYRVVVFVTDTKRFVEGWSCRSLNVPCLISSR